MHDSFTDRARTVLRLANQEAQRFNHEYIGTEHVLLGLLKEGHGLAAAALGNLGVTLDRARVHVKQIVQPSPGMVTVANPPQTPRTKKVIEYAMEEARSLGHPYVGTEDLLLGLLREQESIAVQVLRNIGVEPEKVRQEVLRLLDKDPEREPDVRGPGGLVMMPGDADYTLPGEQSYAFRNKTRQDFDYAISYDVVARECYNAARRMELNEIDCLKAAIVGLSRVKNNLHEARRQDQ